MEGHPRKESGFYSNIGWFSCFIQYICEFCDSINSKRIKKRGYNILTLSKIHFYQIYQRKIISYSEEILFMYIHTYIHMLSITNSVELYSMYFVNLSKPLHSHRSQFKLPPHPSLPCLWSCFSDLISWLHIFPKWKFRNMNPLLLQNSYEKIKIL
jgi:hypothetical protein